MIRRKKTGKAKVTLRFKLLDTGKESLYLDYYPAISDPETGNPTRRKFLQMYVTPLKDKNGQLKRETRKKIIGEYPQIKYEHSDTDMDTIRMAECIRLNRKNVLEKSEIYTETEAERLKAKKLSEGDFLQFFKKLAEEKEQATEKNWNATHKHLTAYTQKTDKKATIRFCDITLQWCEGFRSYLLNCTIRGGKTMKNNTAADYFTKLRTALKTAYRYGYLLKDINADLKGIKEVETHREFLTLDELNALVNAPCTNDVAKRAALFSALTGLRHSDIRKMRWSEITEINGRFTLKYTIQKTGKYDELPISAQAVSLCGERKAPEDSVLKVWFIRLMPIKPWRNGWGQPVYHGISRFTVSGIHSPRCNSPAERILQLFKKCLRIKTSPLPWFMPKHWKKLKGKRRKRLS
jgi:hypothetical protein